MTDRQTDRQTNRQTHTDRHTQTDRRADKLMERQMERQTKVANYLYRRETPGKKANGPYSLKSKGVLISRSLAISL